VLNLYAESLSKGGAVNGYQYRSSIESSKVLNSEAKSRRLR
jgi:hypothetical protein